MRINLSTDYSLRVLLYLGLRMRQSTVKEIAEAFGVSQNHLAKVAHQLMKMGYIGGKKGRGGGIYLTANPKQIRLGDFVRELQTETPLLECFDAHTNTCPIINICRLQNELSIALDKFYESLNKKTLADLIKSSPGDPRLAKLGIQKDDQ